MEKKRKENRKQLNNCKLCIVGASAGGLDALESLVKNIPTDSGYSWIIIQHLSPDHKSMMSELLSKHTSLDVKIIKDQLTFKANTIYVIPPGVMVKLNGSQFITQPKPDNKLTLPIDVLLTSVAEQIPETYQYATAVILSGSGSDGTRGCQLLNDQGGFIIAQTPNTAKFPSMPQSVIDTGIVDDVLAPGEIPSRVVQLGKCEVATSTHKENDECEQSNANQTDARIDILDLIKRSTAASFQEYKTATVDRRIERRMQVRGATNFADYFKLLTSDDDELNCLYHELLIPVTHFFRDAAAFEQLAELALKPLIEHADPDDTLRIWSAGMSSGEEPYSLAMLFNECCQQLNKYPSVKIFGTDINAKNVERASAGRFSDSAIAELTNERVKRFIVRQKNNNVINPDIRQQLVFAKHDLLSDPPFTRMDLVVCRNTLIYFTAEAQKRALDRLQYALRRKGYLFLGSSESLPSNDRLFSALSSKNKIFQLTGERRKRIDRDIEHSFSRRFDAGSSSPQQRRPNASYLVNAELQLVNQFVPPTLLLNSDNQVLQVYGSESGEFFRLQPGSATLSLHRIIPDYLTAVATALVFRATKSQQSCQSIYTHDDNGTKVNYKLIALPIKQEIDSNLVLISFVQFGQQIHDDALGQAVDIDQENLERVELLERELTATRESLQATIEELETSNEELQATNEELMASNEELQSSNEELQSVNEELNTINAENEARISELNALYSDLDSMTKATGIALVFVDSELKITRFSPEAKSIFPLRDSDLGRSLSNFSSALDYDNLITDLKHTVASGEEKEFQVEDQDNTKYLVRIMPYRRGEKSKHGAITTFIDISRFTKFS